jgi:hypothetical protein
MDVSRLRVIVGRAARWSGALACVAAIIPTGCFAPHGPDAVAPQTTSVRRAVAPLPATSPTTQTTDVVVLSNARCRLTVASPDSPNRWYAGPRFDAGTMTPNFHFDGVDVFGPADLTIRADPRLHDNSARGIAGEFDINGPATFAEAKPDGGSFVKIGVGELRRSSGDDYAFYRSYEVVRAPTWKTTVTDNAATVTQMCTSSIGIAYELSRTYQLLDDAPGFTVTTALRNTGPRVIDTEHYFHGFFRVGESHVETGDGARWTFPTTAPVEPHGNAEIVNVDGSSLTFATTMPARGSVYVPLPIAAPAAGRNAITVRRSNVEMTVSPGVTVTRASFWSNEQFSCPEIFSHIVVAPGEAITWTSRFTFRRLDAATKPSIRE